MALYQSPLARDTGLLAIRTTDGLRVSVDPKNADTQEFLKWQAAGGVLDPPPAAPVTFQDKFELQVKLRTTNGSLTTMFQAALPDNTGYVANFTLLAVGRTAQAPVKLWHATTVLKRVNGGFAIKVGEDVPHPAINDAAAAGWTAATQVNGNNFRINVTGEAGVTIDWSLTGTVHQFSPDGLVK